MSDQKKTLTGLLAELKAMQDEYRGKEMPAAVGVKFASLAQEAKGLQDEADREAQIKMFEQASKAIPNSVIPGQKPQEPAESKAAGGKGYVGQMTLGDFVMASSEFKSFIEAGMPAGQFKIVDADIRSRKNRTPMVLLGKDAMQAIQQKAPPTIADRVIPYDRDPDFVLSEEYIPPTLLDIINVVATNAPTVEWFRRNTRTRGADTQSEVISQGVQGLKGEATQGYELVTTPIRTHAVFQPVTEQQLGDFPQLSSLINGDLTDDMNQYLEEQILYGDGIGTNFNGFFQGNNVLPAREESGDSIIDVVRRGITDIRRAQGTPNALLTDPIDWETVVLQKGDDAHYIWAVVTEQGINRLWGLPVIETVKMEASDGERNILIGDFRRGATLYDRMTRSISVGLINDQFVRNMRTILMEARAGFAIRRPAFFSKVVTSEAGS
jgi:hypothetical protein